MKKCIILANGDLPKKSVISFIKMKGYATLICADGGANSARKLKQIPDFIIGDFDSIETSTKNYFHKKSTIIKIERQNDTDVEKCLKFAIKHGYAEVILLGATGSRLDHTICNLGIVLKYFNEIKIRILHENSLLEAVEGNVTLLTSVGEIISLYGFDNKTKITSKGLKYKLNNVALPFGLRESTSNVAICNTVLLKIKHGRIFLIRDYKMMKEYDLF